jgi:hypothetical protein
MARKKLEAKKPKRVDQLPLNEWITGELIAIHPGVPGKHSNRYELKNQDGIIERIYGCTLLDNAINESHIGEIIHIKYTGKKESDYGFQYLLEMEIGVDEFQEAEIVSMVE